jgi:Xaa-Pro aminopeptidase
VTETRLDRRPPLFDYGRATQLMDAANVDILLACSPANVGYLADYTYYVNQGLPYVLEDGKEWSITFVGVPRDPSRAAFITPVSSEHGSIEYFDPWIADRRLWGPTWTYVGTTGVTAPPADVAVCVADALRERGLEGSRIALELAAVPAQRYLRLKELLPRADFVDAAAILRSLRIVKSPEEIRRLREIASATDAAIARGYDALRAGSSELEFQRVMATSLAGDGFRFGWCSVAYGTKGVTLIEPTDRLPTTAEVVRVDLVGFYHGYFSDMSRVASFNAMPDDAARRAHAAILDTNEVMRRETGPGIAASRLGAIAHETLERHGYAMLATQAGHGIGRDVHEPPYLAPWDDAILAPGMVIDLEPAMRVAGVGSVNIEDMVLVTENGCDVLTNFPRALRPFGS